MINVLQIIASIEPELNQTLSDGRLSCSNMIKTIGFSTIKDK